MHKVEVLGTKSVLHIPEDGYEFTRQQFIDFSGLVYKYFTKEIGYRELIVLLTYKICGITKVTNFKKNTEANDKIAENINELSKLIEPYFITEGKNGKQTKVVDCVFMLQKLPVIKHKGVKYYGPADALSDISFSEYLAASNCFFEYSKTGDIKELNRLVAILYRPKKMFKTQKEAYVDALVAKRAIALASLSNDIKHAVYFYFASSQRYITTVETLDIGGGNTVDLSSLFKTSGEGAGDGLGMISVLYSLAETASFANIKDVGDTNLYDVLVLLVKKSIDAKKQKRNANNN